MSSLKKRIVAALGANSFGQATVIVMQLAALPLFLGKWDAATYGTWLMLAAVPAYLAMTDGGLVLAAANKTTMQVAQGDHSGAESTFQSAFAFLSTTGAAVLLLAAIALFVVGMPGIDSEDKKYALIVLATGIIAAQFNGLAETILRATNRYAQGIMLGNISRLLEFTGWICGLYAFGTFVGVAVMGLLFRCTGLSATIYMSTRSNDIIGWGFSKSSMEVCKQLIKPGLQFMAFPLANALSIQSITLIVGHFSGPAAVTVFNTYRTLSRVTLQATTVLANSLWVEFSSMFSTNQTVRLLKLYRRALLISLAASTFVCIAIYVAAPFVIEVWTRGKISYDRHLLIILSLCALVGGSWNVPRVLLMSTNAHGPLSTQALCGAVLTVCIALIATSAYGIYGAAASALVVEIGLAIACLLTAHRLLIKNQKVIH